ncbi:MAG: DUF2252 domain-containing protein [Acidobacteriaceae bacterium]|nr:DUF2252 domain-containing protein [Acidobacteriaceae bacterium]
MDRELRLKKGRDARQKLSRKALAETRCKERNFDPVSLLMSRVEGRIRKLLPVKYARMQASPFTFFRGSVGIMAADLAAGSHTALRVQLCGDAHLENLGSFEGPDGRLIFDINDFDETIEGPWEWDVKRMATSIVLAGLESGHSNGSCETAASEFAGSYCRLMEELADLPVLQAARYQIHRARKSQAVSAAIAQSQRASPVDLLKKYTEAGGNGRRHFKRIEHVLWPIRNRRAEVLHSVESYRKSIAPERQHVFGFFRPKDVAFKIVGTGSVALRDYVVLMEGNGDADALFLQIKQEPPSAYAEYLPGSGVPHQGQRVVEGQRRIQPVSDPLLGWTRIGDEDYLVRQLNDHKGSVDLKNLRGEGLASIAEIAGELLARGHARSGDAVAIGAYMGKPESVVDSISRFATAYAKQVQSDFEAFEQAIKKGRVKVAA